MFFCDDCADERNWKKGNFKSKGKCELCGKYTLCSDVRSSEIIELKDIVHLGKIKKGYRFDYGIWNFNHDITSRDGGISEIHETTQEIEKIRLEKTLNYAKMGYELWFFKVFEVDIVKCECGKYYQVNNRCWYCGKE